MDRSAYRIIDANFNRAREAARVIEEFCRFSLNCKPLTGQAKALRHELSAVIATLDQNILIASRDTTGDVGIGQEIDSQMQRQTVEQSFTAACKRLAEALRVLAEMLQGEHAAQAKLIEQLRYRSYKLEQDITVFYSPLKKFERVSLYVIVSTNLPAEIIRLTNGCIKGGADCIQLRAKDIETDTLIAVASELVKACRQANVLSIINDRVDVAVVSEADGVHLGQTDLSIEHARKLQRSPLIIGKSTHSPDQLQQVIGQLPTYVSLGPIFPTPTKPTLESVGIDYVKQGLKTLYGTGIKAVAIGGITPNNLTDVLSAGVQTVAVCSAVSGEAEPAAACRKFKQIIRKFRG